MFDDEPTMNIYAKNGDRVVYAFPKHGRDWDRVQATEHLELGKTYTVDRTSVGSSNTAVWLQEIPGIAFNSVQFKDAG